SARSGLVHFTATVDPGRSKPRPKFISAEPTSRFRLNAGAAVRRWAYVASRAVDRYFRLVVAVSHHGSWTGGVAAAGATIQGQDWTHGEGFDPRFSKGCGGTTRRSECPFDLDR